MLRGKKKLVQNRTAKQFLCKVAKELLQLHFFKTIHHLADKGQGCPNDSEHGSDERDFLWGYHNPLFNLAYN